MKQDKTQDKFIWNESRLTQIIEGRKRKIKAHNRKQPSKGPGRIQKENGSYSC